MENIELKAKYQLLNIQQTDSNFAFYGFQFKPPSLTAKSKNRSSARVFTSLSSHTQSTLNPKQNHKQALKDKLKKLLQKDSDSPKFTLKRVKTIGSQTTKNCNKNSQNYPESYNQQILKTKRPESNTCLTLQKQNISLSQKSLTPYQSRKNAISLFEKQSEQVRKFIKKKMEQKAQQREKKNLLSSNVVSALQKMKNFIRQKGKSTIQSNEGSLLLKVKVKGNKGQDKRQIQRGIKKKSKDKENIQIITTSPSTPLIKIKKQNNFQSRKLRNLLF